MRVHTAEEAAFLKALVFSPPGHGKTRFLGTADDDERTAPLLFLDFEGGTQTLVGRDTDVVTVRSWQDYNEAYAELADPGTKYRSVAIDSVTETQVGGLLAILDKDGKRADPDQLAQADWGLILMQMRRFARRFRDLPMHVFMSALAKDDVAPRIGTVKTPLLQGAFASEVSGIMDVVAYLALDEGEDGEAVRLMLLHSYPKFQVKARTPWGVTVPSEIEDPTAGKLLDALGYK